MKSWNLFIALILILTASCSQTNIENEIGFDIFENSKIGYSYSHISNNDWGETNPGTDNQQITFSKNF